MPRADLERRRAADDGREPLTRELQSGHVLGQLRLDAPVAQRLLLRRKHRLPGIRRGGRLRAEGQE